MTASFRSMFVLRFKTIKEVDVCLTLNLSSVIGSYRDIFMFISKKSKMSASQKEYFPFFVSQYFVTLKATREETYSFFSFMSE